MGGEISSDSTARGLIFTSNRDMISKQVEEVTAAVKREFGGLNENQLNQKPEPDKWSIAQCLDHLVVYNETFITEFEKLLSGKYKPTLWQRINPLTKFAGERGLDLLRAGKIKMKAPAIFAPSKDPMIRDIMTRFLDHQKRLGSIFDKLEQGGMHNKVISSPLTPALTLTAGDAMHIMAEHEDRHLKQAMNVKQTTGV